MRRFHQDLPLMFARRQFALSWYDVHENDRPAWVRRVTGLSLWRKRHPLDCGKARCGTCHGEKFYASKARGAKLRAAIDFEMRAEGS